MTAHLDPAPWALPRPHHHSTGFTPSAKPLPLEAREILDRLLCGNLRHAAGERMATGTKSRVLATVLTCCDLTPAPEQIFDTAPGELIVTASAAHLVDTAALVGVEYGVEILKTPLVVVLAHEPCPIIGRITADIRHGHFPENHCRAVAEQLVLHTLAAESNLSEITRRHLRASIVRLREASATLSGDLSTERSSLVGLSYNTRDRLVRQIEPHPRSDSLDAVTAAMPQTAR